MVQQSRRCALGDLQVVRGTHAADRSKERQLSSESVLSASWNLLKLSRSFVELLGALG